MAIFLSYDAFQQRYESNKSFLVLDIPTAAIEFVGMLGNYQV